MFSTGPKAKKQANDTFAVTDPGLTTIRTTVRDFSIGNSFNGTETQIGADLEKGVGGSIDAHSLKGAAFKILPSFILCSRMSYSLVAV